MCSAHRERRRAGRAFARTFRGISPERAHTVEAVCAPFSFEAAPVLQTGLLLTVPVRSNCGCSVRDVYYPGGLPIRCLSYAPFSFEAAHGVLQCHGELVAVPRAEGCTQWLLLVCRRAA